MEKKKHAIGLMVEEEVELAGLQELADQSVEGLTVVDPERLDELRAKYVEITGGDGNSTG